MGTLQKSLLIASSVGFAFSLTAAGSNVYYGAIRPLSAALFIVFLVTHFLRKEVAAYDAEQARKQQLYGGNGAANSKEQAHPGHGGAQLAHR